MGAIWEVLGPLGALLGLVGDSLGAFWAILGDFGGLWGNSWVFFRDLGDLGVCLGSFWARFLILSPFSFSLAFPSFPLLSFCFSLGKAGRS